MKTKYGGLNWDVALLVAVVFIAGLCSPAQQLVCADDRSDPEGKIVQIAPGSDDPELSEGAIVDDSRPANQAPVYWIGISGRSVQSPVLRTHLQLSEDLGIVVEQVAPESPAVKAGLRRHDVLLRANGEPLYGMATLQKLVGQLQTKPIELQLIRVGKETTLVVVPEERPEGIAESLGQRLLPGQPEGMRDWLEQFQIDGNLPEGLRRFGPGVMFDTRRFNVGGLPDGTSVSVARENDGPAKITVKRGDQTWEVEDGDEASLEQLPEDLREYVSQLLDRQGRTDQRGRLDFDWETELPRLIPQQLRRFELEGNQDPAGDRIQQRLQQLEQQLRDLQRRLSEEEGEQQAE